MAAKKDWILLEKLVANKWQFRFIATQCIRSAIVLKKYKSLIYNDLPQPGARISVV
jgi:hypothetical protein